jgi:hypothetical protein
VMRGVNSQLMLSTRDRPQAHEGNRALLSCSDRA